MTSGYIVVTGAKFHNDISGNFFAATKSVVVIGVVIGKT